MNVDLCLRYLEFVAERHRIWELRQAGAPQPWTDDPILASRKFTNTFRILDPGSQFVLTDLYDPADSPEDNLMRFTLYRHTGRVEPWRWLALELGRYPLLTDLDDVFDIWNTYRGGKMKFGTQGDARGQLVRKPREHLVTERPIFTGAYLVFPQSQERGTDKLASIIDLAKRLFVTGSAGRDFLAATTQAARFTALRRNNGVADFMSHQILTDWGYTTVDRENEFIVAGPGAVKGCQLLFPGQDPVKTIRWAQSEVAQLDVQLPNGRRPSLADLQSCYCEFFKYHRYMQKPTSAAPPYRPAHPGPQPAPLLPKLW